MDKNLKKKIKKESLVYTLAYAFLGVGIIVLLLVTLLDFYISYRTQQVQTFREQRLIAQKVAMTLQNRIEHDFEALNLAVVLGDLAVADEVQEKLMLEKLLGRHPSFRQLVKVDQNGHQTSRVARVSNLLLGRSDMARIEESFGHVQSGERYFSPVYINEVTSEPMAILAVAVENVLGDFKGALIAEVNLKFLWDLVGLVKVGKNGLAYVVDKNGSLIAAKDITRVLKGENLSYIEEVREFMDKEMEKIDIDIAKGLNGTYVMDTYDALNDPDWGVIVELPVKEAYAPLLLKAKLSGLIVLLVVFLTIFSGFYLAKKITNPIVRLRDATRELSEGRLDPRIDIKSEDEIGELADSFNQMVVNLRLTTVSRDALAQEVKERKKAEAQLRQAYQELERAQMQLIQSEKMASLGQLAAGVAHEINNPIGFISSNLETLGKYLRAYSAMISALTELKDAVDKGNEKTARKAAERVNILKEKEKFDFVSGDVVDLIAESRNGIERIKKIVMDLRTFARKDEEDMMLNSIEEVIDGALNIVANEIKYKAELVKEYGNVPLLRCSSQKLGQVFINLLINAAQAIRSKGRITIRTFVENENVCVQISDTGSGIPKEHLDKIFDPFFTTKDIGKGTGLGLSISYDLIKQNNGTLEVDSEINKGTAFTLRFPLRRTEETVS